MAVETERMMQSLRGTADQKARIIWEHNRESSVGGVKSEVAATAAPGTSDSKIISLKGGCFVRVSVTNP